ncbi:predicted protein [Naegleria gruberi]|uniref:Predicted protein n=1 Tax=Naegleria gruberi TaxID=5762 RepID=D2VLB6_NAEGR|nr:uncharacterized protein NAEGRDRAFT_69722 [Naegleria gruberi]EFC42359.1 predicted protein [Naegleria gruberi]|eukprot:XP_002675103.1 predicted protein [Naegleria gruberi strain NEG-M]
MFFNNPNCPLKSMKTKHVILMNPFHIDSKDEKEFELAWVECAQFLKKQDGYIHTSLHKALDMEKSQYQYINYAHWESPEKFQKAMTEMRNISDCVKKMAQIPHQNFPSLYKVHIEM